MGGILTVVNTGAWLSDTEVYNNLFPNKKIYINGHSIFVLWYRNKIHRSNFIFDTIDHILNDHLCYFFIQE